MIASRPNQSQSEVAALIETWRMTALRPEAATWLNVSFGRPPVELRQRGAISRAPYGVVIARDQGKRPAARPLPESFDVCVGEQQCAMRNVGLVA
jgi:hypothetical protein